jgi:hypothetical protein
MATNDPSHFLLEGLDASQREELGDLEAVTKRLASMQITEPTQAEQSALMNSLKANLIQTGGSRFGIKAWLRLALAQARLFEVEFWYACAGMMLFTLLTGALVGNGALSLFTLMVSPLVAMVGVFYIFHRDTSSLSVLEAASPVGPQALFFCRSALILGINLAALPLLLIPGQMLFPQLAFWRVVVIGLGALVGLFGLATYTTLRWNGLMGIVLPLGIWGLLVSAGWQRAIENTGGWNLAPEWIMNSISASDGLLVGALLMLICGGWLLFQASYWVKKDIHSWA